MAAINCMLIRGGTSRGAYFLANDLPNDVDTRNAVLARAMGGPDSLQVDGLGGGHPLTSKTAVVSLSSEPNVDVDYLFLQVDPVKQTVSDVQNCGNILSGVGLFAIAHKLVAINDPITTVRVRLLNTGAICHLGVQTPDGRVQIAGTTAIDGVPGTAAPLVCDYLNIAGSTCGALFPTGNLVDTFDDVRVTCVDNGMPVVVILAQDVGISGSEAPDLLDADVSLKHRLESIRLQAGSVMNLGDVREKTVPKLCLVSPSVKGGLVTTRTFIPHVCHKSIGVLGAVSVATACLAAGTPAHEIAVVPMGNPKVIDVEHPAGSLQVRLELDSQGNVCKAGVVRTARVIFHGEIYV